jgi:hypothetical protein
MTSHYLHVSIGATLKPNRYSGHVVATGEACVVMNTGDVRTPLPPGSHAVGAIVGRTDKGAPLVAVTAGQFENDA